MNNSLEVEAYLGKAREKLEAEEAESNAAQQAIENRKLAITSIRDILQGWINELNSQGQSVSLTEASVDGGFDFDNQKTKISITTDTKNRKVIRVRHNNWVTTFEFQSSETNTIWQLPNGEKIDGKSVFSDRELASLILNETFDNKIMGR
jgi:hypothetical protein